MRSSRLLSILLLLQTRGRMTADQLSEELEVSVRTIYRDIEALSASGVPVYADRGAHGGFQLVEGYRTRLTGLTAEEAETLFLSGYPGPAAELGLGTVLAAAQLKVLAALPAELRSRASRLRQRFHLDAPGWFQEPDAAPHLQPIAEAVWSDHRLLLLYRRPGEDEPVERRVDPLGVVLKGGVWYLVASVASRLRTYRISRIVQTTLLEERFERPEEFDLAGYWQGAVEAYVQTFPSLEATVRVRGEGLEHLATSIGEGRVRAAIEQSSGPDPDGWYTLRFDVEDLWRGEQMILGLGPDAEVLEPVELRERVTRKAVAMAAAYAGHPVHAGHTVTGPAPD